MKATPFFIIHYINYFPNTYITIYLFIPFHFISFVSFFTFEKLRTESLSFKGSGLPQCLLKIFSIINQITFRTILFYYLIHFLNHYVVLIFNCNNLAFELEFTNYFRLDQLSYYFLFEIFNFAFNIRITKVTERVQINSIFRTLFFVEQKLFKI